MELEAGNTVVVNAQPVIALAICPSSIKRKSTKRGTTASQGGNGRF
jgi:hypothetical protein